METTDKGYVRIYTGNGQGKTMAAFGVAMRALCAGKRVYVAQFVKNQQYNEYQLPKYFDNLQVELFGMGCFIDREPCREDREAAVRGLHKCREIMASGTSDVVVMDELCIALHYDLLTVEQVLDALSARRENVEVIITGRYAPQALIDVADLVTEMCEIKHYYTQGILSRDGFDR